jgi:uncharacterized protein (DUF1778 family)
MPRCRANVQRTIAPRRVRTIHDMAELKSRHVSLDVAARDDALFQRAAAEAEESLSEFLLESGRERAERLLADRTRFTLSEDAWAAFTEALERPADPSPALVDLFRRPRPE